MANRLYVDTVQIRYLRNKSTVNKDLFGFLVFDDHDEYQVTGFQTESELPVQFEDFLRYVSLEDHTAAWDLINQHMKNENGVCFDGSWIDHEEVMRLIESLKDEADK